MYGTNRRRFLGTAAAVVGTGLAGCTGGGGGSDDPTATPGGGGSASGEGSTGGSSDGSDGSGSGSGTDGSSDDAIDCGVLSGSPTPYDAAGTPFVFTFDYVDSWTVEEPLQGANGRLQEISSPRTGNEGASVTVRQPFEAVTAADVEDVVTEVTAGEYARFAVLHEQEFNGETVRVIGSPDGELPYYRTWLPYGEGEARYFPLELTALSTMIDSEEDRTLCVEPTTRAVETVRESLAVNPDSTIADVLSE